MHVYLPVCVRVCHLILDFYVVLQEMLKFKSQFCHCCGEERWVTTSYHENERGEKRCRRCMNSINALEMPLFSAANNMVGNSFSNTSNRKHKKHQRAYVAHTCARAQIPGVLPLELRNFTALEYRITSPAALLIQIYCVRGTG